MFSLITTVAIWSASIGPTDTVFPCISQREVVNMPWMPGTGRTAPSRSVQFGSHISVQVNVDANGNNILGDAANEPSIAVDPTNPDRMAIGWRQFDSVNSDFRQAGYGYSADAGRHWTFPGVLEPGVFRSDPVLSASPSGVFYYCSLEVYSGFTSNLFVSIDHGVTWQKGAIASQGDKPWMTSDTSHGPGRGMLYTIAAGRPGYRSPDGGTTWAALNSPRITYGTMAIGRNSELFIGNSNDYTNAFSVSTSTDAFDINIAPSFVTQPVDLISSEQEPICQQIDSPNPDGLLGQAWVACDVSVGPFQNYVYLLCSAPNYYTFTDDVKFARSTDRGNTWSNPRRINDDPGNNCAWHWFGTMSVAPDGRIDVIWNDTRHFSQDNLMSELFYSASYDGGATWTPNEQLSPAWDSFVGWPQQNKIGDYYHMVSDSVGANLAYAATFNGEQDVWFLRIGDYLCQGLIAEQPASPAVCAGSSVSLHTSAAPRGGTITYQWRKDGANLSDSANRLGTQSPTLVILHAAAADAGYYECLVKLEGCGADMTNTAKLTVFSTGSADGNADGLVDARDIQPFINALTSFAPVSAQLCAYDLTGEGIVNLEDLPPFVTRLLGG